ncbi:MAG: hypothetical protein JWM34_3941 [Ilumatobacteraceae bacterium]|nr:hypothetical protein [Ilumatobacteraceae bacterium]
MSYIDPDVQPVVAGRTVSADGRTMIVEAPVATARVAEPVVVASPVSTGRVETTYGRRYAFDSFIVGLVGLALLIVGLVAAVRAGFDGPMSTPVVKVLGYTHTTTLGLIEIGIGVCLLIAAAATSRGAEVFFGLALAVGAIVGAVQTESFRRDLALQSSLAWIAAVAGAVVVLVSLIVPRMTTRTARVESI